MASSLNGPIWQWYDPRNGHATKFVEMLCYCVPQGRYEVRESIQRKEWYAVCTSCGGHRNPHQNREEFLSALGLRPSDTEVKQLAAIEVEIKKTGRLKDDPPSSISTAVGGQPSSGPSTSYSL
jgi:hypothetical protein